MPLDPSFNGRVYPPTPPYLVGREKIREFSRAIGDRNPAYHDQAAARALGYADVVAPPTFAIVLTMPAGNQVTFDPELGLDYSKVVHGEQRFVYRRPIVAGDELNVVVTVENIRSAGGNDMISLRADVNDLNDELVVAAYSTIVARGTAGGGLMSRLSRDGVEVGTVVPEQTFVLQRVNLVRYAGASGDFNEIHWNPTFATEVGLPGTIAHGMLTMAQAVRVVTDWCGDPGAVLEYGVRFTRPVPVADGPGTELQVGGEVREIRPDGCAVVSLTVTTGGQTVLAKARAVVQLA